MEAPQKRRRSSTIWNDFTRSETNTICNKCGKLFSLNTSTYSLKYHLETHEDENENQQNVRTDFDKKKADELLTALISSHCLPLRLVEGEDFRNFVSYLSPDYKLPSRQKLSNKLLPDKQTILTNKMKDKILRISYFSLSIDSWTSFATRSYVAITAHGITRDTWSLESFLLTFAAVTKNKQDGKYLANVIRDTLEY